MHKNITSLPTLADYCPPFPYSPLDNMVNHVEVSCNSLLARPSPFNLPVIGLLDILFASISPALPKDVTSTPFTPSPLPDRVVPFHFSTDEAHGGRLVVPKTLGASIPLSVALKSSNFVRYVQSNLLFSAPHAVSSESEELVFFSPGLNTLLEPTEGEIGSLGRLDHYTKVLAGFPMASIHTGTSKDQEPIMLDLPWWKKMLIRILPEAARPESLQNGKLSFGTQSIDAIQTVLSYVNHWDTPIKKSFRELFEMTKSDNAVPFVLMTYSRASVECDAALRKHVDDSKKTERDSEIRERLRKYVTVVTIGNASRFFEDGPAYIHVASWADRLTSLIGVNGKNRRGGGKDAVYINFDLPWNKGADDNHNFSAGVSQYLCLIMAEVGAKGYRDLWEKGQVDGVLKELNGGDELLRAMIKVTRGDELLWKPEQALNDVDEGILPEEDEGLKIVTEKMGEEFAKAIRLNFE